MNVLFPKCVRRLSPSDSNGISDLKVVDTLISEREGFNLLLEPLPTKIIFPLGNGTGIHCEPASINLSLLLGKADEVWFCFSAQSHRANYGKSLIYRSTSKALEWDVCLFTLLPFILHYLFMLPAHGFERLIWIDAYDLPVCTALLRSSALFGDAANRPGLGGGLSLNMGLKPNLTKKLGDSSPVFLLELPQPRLGIWYLVWVSSCNLGCVEASWI